MNTAVKEREILKEQQVTLPSKKRDSLPVRIGKIIAWQFAAVLFVEGALFAAGLGEEEIFRLDPELGFKHMTNKRITWRSEGLGTSYLNFDGLREANVTVAKPAGTYRIALLGDSLTESLQVPLEQSFSYQVEQELKSKLGRSVQVLNFGTSGYSTAQEYLQLKKQVAAYKPDLVLLCYNNRDCFENWSPPDEVLTNVRPAALHLPGGKLVVDTSPVALWMRSPRAKFLKNVEFLRQHSRLWGLLSAAELDLSMHNETYKRVLFFLTKPGKALRQTGEEIGKYLNSLGKKSGSEIAASPAVSISNKSEAKSEQAAPAPAQAGQPALVQAASNLKVASSSVAKVDSAKPSEPPHPNNTYRSLIERTLGSLLGEMKTECAKWNGKFAVVALPVRSALSVRQGMEDKFFDMSYGDELAMLKGVCKPNDIAVVDIQDSAKALSDQDKDYLFYLVHLTPRGHKFVASQLAPAVENIVAGKENP